MATKKKENAVPEIIDNVEALEAKMKAMREAQKKFATYTQEQVDKIFFEAAMAANKMRIPLAKMAVDETGKVIEKEKIIKKMLPRQSSRPSAQQMSLFVFTSFPKALHGTLPVNSNQQFSIEII